VLVPLLLATFAFSKRVSRHPTLFTLLLASVIYSFGTSILLYTGHDDGPQPPHALCLAQLSLIHGGLIMAAAAALSLVVYMLLTIPTLDGPRDVSIRTRVILGSMGPLTFVLYVLVLAEINEGKPGTIIFSRGRVTHLCTFATGTPTFIVKAPIIVIGVGVSVALAVTGFILYKVIHLLRGTLGGWKIREALRSPHGPWLRLLFRFIIFVLYVLVAAISCVAEIPTKDGSVTHDAVDIVVGTFPMALFLIFGTQTDVLRVWRFWRRAKKGDPETASIDTAGGQEKPAMA